MRISFGSRQLLRNTVSRCLDLAAKPISTHSSAQRGSRLSITHSAHSQTSAHSLRQAGCPPPQCYGQPRQWPTSAPENRSHLKSHKGRTARASASMAAQQLPAGDVFFLDEFAVRQWNNANCSGTKIDHDMADFVARVHKYHAEGSVLVDGYAPFCKHIFVPNFVGAKLGSLPITEQNRSLLRSAYVKRRPEELAVLARWFPEEEVEIPQAQYLDIILYSREQLTKEYTAMPDAKGNPQLLPQAPWGIISIKAQEEDYETPMQPITVMRNSLGKNEGGSGVDLNRAAYEESVAYWQTHAAIAPGETPDGE